MLNKLFDYEFRIVQIETPDGITYQVQSRPFKYWFWTDELWETDNIEIAKEHICFLKKLYREAIHWPTIKTVIHQEKL